MINGVLFHNLAAVQIKERLYFSVRQRGTMILASDVALVSLQGTSLRKTNFADSISGRFLVRMLKRRHQDIFTSDINLEPPQSVVIRRYVLVHSDVENEPNAGVQCPTQTNILFRSNVC